MTTARPAIRRLTVADLLDETIKQYRRNFWVFTGIVAAIELPILVVMSLIQIFSGVAEFNRFSFDPEATDARLSRDFTAVFIGFALIGVLGIVRALLTLLVMNPAIIRTLARSYLGQPTTFVEAYKLGWRRFFYLVGATILYILPFIGIVVVAVLVFSGALVALFFVTASIGGAGSRSGTALIVLTVLLWLVVVGLVFIASIIPFVYFYTRLAFINQAVVVEDKGPVEAVKRSWNLVRGHFWRTLGIIVLLTLLGLFLSYIPTQILQFVSFLPIPGAVIALIQGLGTTVLTILVTPVTLIGLTLLYFDLRVRKEAFDLEIMAQQLTASLPPPDAPAVAEGMRPET